MHQPPTFQAFFEAATGSAPYDYQVRLASLPPRSLALRVPTGGGKTAAVVLAWLWIRCSGSAPDAPAPWPRRLVYCLPMRTLVEQTRQEADRWLARLARDGLVSPAVRAFTLMGGQLEEGWERHPERPAILVGTQDML